MYTVCSVNQVQQRLALQFGRIKCPLNYIVDYTVYAFSPYTNGEYICVDKDAHGYGNGDFLTSRVILS